MAAQRVDQLAELQARYGRLVEFISDNELYLALPDNERADMALQAILMHAYADVLLRRLERVLP